MLSSLLKIILLALIAPLHVIYLIDRKLKTRNLYEVFASYEDREKNIFLPKTLLKFS